MTMRSRAALLMSMIVASIVLAACQQHPESAGSRAGGQHRGPYGGVEGGSGL